MDDALSTNTSRIYDYEDIYWTENRSEKLYDPLLMAKVKVGKLKKDGPSSSKAQVHKTPKKRVENLLLQFLDLHYLRQSDDFKYQDSTNSSLVQRYFPDLVKYNSVSKGRFVQHFLQGNWDNIQEAFQMGILYFINSFVLSQLPDVSIHVNDFLMVVDVVNDEITVKERDYIPRILNWRVIGVKPKFEMFMSSIFTENACTNIQPTPEELEALDLLDNMGVSHSEHSTSTDKPTQAISDDISGFEDFSSKPPDQILMRSRRVSSTSSTPPPKRRKKVDLAEPKSSAMEQSEWSPVIQKKVILYSKFY
ncbi:hypothetical protein KY289_030294 [Solanum tuberosum]|nr:hypothetical protein KY289_030294 [Solanum tuberosum]